VFDLRPQTPGSRGIAPRTVTTYETTLNVLERACKPQKLAYYVGQNAEATADAIWAAAGTKLGTIRQLADNNCDMQKSKNSSDQSES
jgi:hypothetical protein